MHNDDDHDFLDYARGSVPTNAGPYRSGADQFAFADELERPEDPALRDEPLLTYKSWAIATFVPVIVATLALALFFHPYGLLADIIYNVILPGFVLYRAFAICRYTARWWFACRSWAVLDRRIASVYADAGFVSLALLMVWGAIFAVGLIRFVPIVGGLVSSIGTFPGFGLLMLSLFYPPIARAVVRGLFTAKNSITGGAVSDPYEIELALFESQVITQDGRTMARVVSV